MEAVIKALTQISKQIDGLTQEQKQLSLHMDRLEQTVTQVQLSLEQQTDPKLSLLFEGHENIVQRIDSLHNTVARLEQRTNSIREENVYENQSLRQYISQNNTEIARIFTTAMEELEYRIDRAPKYSVK